MTITIKHSIFINAYPEVVWDFTQDYNKRTTWDKSIKSVTVIQEEPNRIVEIRSAGRLSGKLVYKLNDRPNKTTLVMKDVRSPFITGGGGSWKYEPVENGTLWTQTNSLILDSNFTSKLMKGLIERKARKNTISSMKAAKRMIESE